MNQTEYRYGEIKELKTQPNSQKAKELLQKLANATMNILNSRKWKVKVLREFFPTNKNLLGMNVNHGAAIMIRLRHGHNNLEFLEWHDILGTLCHELAHMKISPHNAAFYKLWDELSDEVANQSSSSSSTVVFGSGQILGGSKIQTDMNTTMAQAAIKRQRLEVLSQGSGKKLGGLCLGKKLSPNELRNLIATAAERRARDELWCPTKENDEGNFHPSTVTNLNSLTNWICETCTEPNNKDNLNCLFCGLAKETPIVRDIRAEVKCLPCKSSSSKSQQYTGTSTSEYNWICAYCTFENENNETSICSICNQSALVSKKNKVEVIDLT